MQNTYKLITDDARFSPPSHYAGTARRPVQAVAKPSGWRVTLALAAITFATVFAVVAFI